MALYDKIGGADGSPANRVSRNVETSTRQVYPFYKDGIEGTAEITERVQTTIDQFVACTKAAVESEADVIATQSLFPIGNQQISCSYSEDQRVIGSYTFNKTFVERTERITKFTEGPPDEEEQEA
jgi:hypothetical protein